MTKKDLNQFYWLKKEYHQLKKELEELRENLLCHSVVITDMPKGTRRNDKLATHVSNIVDIEERLTIVLQHLSRERIRLEDFIATIDDSEMRLIMRLRHVECMTWAEIGEEINYSKTCVYTKYHKFFKKEQKEQPSMLLY